MHIIIEYFVALYYMLFSKKVRVIPFSRFDKSTFFEGNNFVGKKSIIKKCSIGRYTYLGSECVFTNCSIGRFCSISSNVQVITGRHPSSVFVSTHPLFYSTNHPTGDTFVSKRLFEEFVYTSNGKSLEIGNDVWIGRNVMIMEGLTIGDGAIVATGSIVTKNVEPYTVVGGCPAKVIRRRFDDKQCEKLRQIKWWDWDNDVLSKSAYQFSDIKLFLNSYDETK